jgi:hypothetical protein
VTKKVANLIFRETFVKVTRGLPCTKILTSYGSFCGKHAAQCLETGEIILLSNSQLVMLL